MLGTECLPVEIAFIEHVAIDDRHGAHPDPGECLDHGASQAAQTDNAGPGLKQRDLVVHGKGIHVANIAFRNDVVFEGQNFDFFAGSSPALGDIGGVKKGDDATLGAVRQRQQARGLR